MLVEVELDFTATRFVTGNPWQLPVITTGVVHATTCGDGLDDAENDSYLKLED